MSEKKTASRRDFLKTSAVASAGLAAGLSVARGAHAAGTGEIKVALIGAGGRGSGAIMQLMDGGKNVKLMAVADAFEDRIQSLKDKINKTGKYEGQVELGDRVFLGMAGYKQIVETDADLVAIATPPGFRPPMYEAAIKAGKHVFMEKPCCVDGPGYIKLMETNKLADEKNLLVGVGLQRRHQPDYNETMAKIHDGAIGDVLFTRVYWNGAKIWNRRVEELAKILGRTPTEMEYQVYNWYHFCWLSGDNICEQHIHNLDIGNWVHKDAHPVEANGMGGCTARYLGENKGTGQIFDHHFVEYTYENGAKMFSQCRHMFNTFTNVSEAAHGTLGTSDCMSEITGPNAWKRDRRAKKVSGHAQEQLDHVDALMAGKRYNEGYYGANSSMTSVLGRLANYSGKVVKWDDAVNKGFSEFPEILDWDAPAPVTRDENGDYPIPMPGVFEAHS